MATPPNIPRQADLAPSVSVVVPSFNHARFIEKTLRSIFRQTLAPLKLLVIDDGSTDDSPRVIAGVLEDAPFPVELIARGNRGLCATLNEGLSKTSGDYFAYLGSDDVWLSQFLNRRVETLKTRPTAVLGYGNGYSIDDEDRIIDSSADWAAYVDGSVRAMLLAGLGPLSPTVVYRRAAVEKYGWNEAAALEDYELYLRLSIDGEFAFDRTALSAWRQHQTNASADLTMMMNEKLAALERVASHLRLSDSELKRARSVLLFRSAQEFMRIGEKKTATRLARQSKGGLAPTMEKARMVIGLLTPAPVLAWNLKRKRRNAYRSYGKLQY